MRMSVTAICRAAVAAAPPSLPARAAPQSGWYGAREDVLVRIIQPVRGSAPFLAQHLAQEVLESGRYLPRWQERAAAYGAAPAPRAQLDLLA